MGLLDFIIDIICILLWANWRMGAAASRQRYRVGGAGLGFATQYDATFLKKWRGLIVIVVILIIRPFIYWEVGSSVGWIPVLKFGAVSVPFQVDVLLQVQIFSLCSFVQILLIFYSWVILVWALSFSIRSSETNPLYHALHLLLKPIEHWPSTLQLCLLGVVAMPLWICFSLLIQGADVIPPQSMYITFREGLVMAICAYMPLCHLMSLLILIYFLNSYIYLGSSPIWNYLHLVTRNALKPIYFFPLQISKIDLAPLAGIAIFYLLHTNGMKLFSTLFTLAGR